MHNVHPVKNMYSVDSYHAFDDVIPVTFDMGTLPADWDINVTGTLDPELFAFVPDNKDAMRLTIEEDDYRLFDGYAIDTRKNRITIKAGNERGAVYALNTLNDVTKNNGLKGQLPVVLIEDSPSIEKRGIIEGYYGPPWTFDERMGIMDFMVKKRLNVYMYGPKSDPWHREKWSDPYPDEWIKAFKALNDKANKNHIDTYYTISPGYIKEGEYAFDYTNEDDFLRLFRKMDQMREAGFTHFGLLMDDIDFNLDDKNKAKFKRPGIAHASICNRLFDYLKGKDDAIDFVMCPTEYHQIGETTYRTDLKEHLHDDIAVFFTGDNVCAETIPKDDLVKTKKAFGKPLYIWDNFPVSDFTHGLREFLAPIKNRYVKMGDHVDAYLINPSIHCHISKIGMWTMADYAWDSAGYHAEVSFEHALNQFGHAFYHAQKGFVDYNYANVLSHNPNQEHIRLVEMNDEKAIRGIAVELKESAEALLALDLNIIDELSPWLKRAKDEAAFIVDVLEEKATHDVLLEYFKIHKRLGSELLERLVKKKGLLSKQEEKDWIDKTHEAEWYRIFEEAKHA